MFNNTKLIGKTGIILIMHLHYAILMIYLILIQASSNCYNCNKCSHTVYVNYDGPGIQVFSFLTLVHPF